jgi:hypothetical protein
MQSNNSAQPIQTRTPDVEPKRGASNIWKKWNMLERLRNYFETPEQQIANPAVSGLASVLGENLKVCDVYPYDRSGDREKIWKVFGKYGKKCVRLYNILKEQESTTISMKDFEFTAKTIKLPPKELVRFLGTMMEMERVILDAPNNQLEGKLANNEICADSKERGTMLKQFRVRGLEAYNAIVRNFDQISDNQTTPQEVLENAGFAEPEIVELLGFMEERKFLLYRAQAPAGNEAELAKKKNIELLRENNFGKDGERLYLAILAKMDEIANSDEQEKLIAGIVGELQIDVISANRMLDFMLEKGMI